MTTGPDHPDRRDTERLRSKLPLYVDGQQARLKNFSSEGVGFTTAEPPPTGSVVQVGVRYLPDDEHPKPCEAEVVRVQPDGPGLYDVGARIRKPRKG